ncbi:sulfatase-like hydrolase/transferase [Niabella insulamsoli]|uniref:sulfatase-like hydrolase/transferase n=1 Tax=Niabella insulamsoli TaxID=3144874 RepID=UPI0031FE2966
MRSIVIALFCMSLTGLAAGQKGADSQGLPNILWLTSEDNSPLLGCYGDAWATTPNLDELAKQGFLYTHAYANAPVCAPMRNAIITGVYAASSGHQHMRSNYPKSSHLKLLPAYLRKAGYYCTNNVKTDYNIASEDQAGWNESSKKAHYKNRKPGQPFFAVFNCTISHESYLHRPDSGKKLKPDPSAVQLAPYHPDSKEMRRDYARYYEAVEAMDAWVGEKLKELEEAGLAENTIVIYYSDHGGILGRSKRFLYETGTRVPLVIRIPDRFKNLYPAPTPGSGVDRMVSLVDLFPTMLSIAGTSIPGHLQGHAFLGTQKTADPEFVHMFRGRMDERIDMSRAVRNERFRYIRNFLPYRPYAQHIDYLWKAPSMQAWYDLYQQGKCNEIQSRFFQAKPVEELYDTENDPWEVHNLASDPQYRKVLSMMRTENKRWMKQTLDAGLMPEGMLASMAQTGAVYDKLRSGYYPIDDLLAISDLANFAQPKDIEKLTEALRNDNAAIRCWAARGLLQLGNNAAPAIASLKEALTDTVPDVAIVAAETLYNLGQQDAALPVLFRLLKDKNEMVQLHALNAIDNSCKRSDVVKKQIEAFLSRQNDTTSKYLIRIAEWILEKPR